MAAKKRAKKSAKRKSPKAGKITARNSMFVKAVGPANKDRRASTNAGLKAIAAQRAAGAGPGNKPKKAAKKPKKAAKPKSAKQGKSPRSVRPGPRGTGSPGKRMAPITVEARRLARTAKFAKLDKIDAKLKRKPTSLLQAFLNKAPEHMAELKREVDKRTKKA